MRKKTIKYISILALSVVSFLTTTSFGNYQDFLGQLKIMDIAVDDILVQESISRYDLAKLLNAVECEDCINAPSWMIDRYTNPFWNTFTQLPGKDFDDIQYQQAKWNNDSYYYCVAYVGDNNYMRGYPVGISPVCAGAFCGPRNTTKAEFLQVIINIIAPYTYSNYTINWRDANSWIQKINRGSREDTYINETDRQRVTEGRERCGKDDCQLNNPGEFETYLKYCMFNTKDCQMQTFGWVKQGYWPVAELNILNKEGIISLQEAQKDDIHYPVDGEKVLNILYKLYEIVQCQFNNDYDCDLLTNAKDNCPNHYNPTQRDMDNDGIGDVCDDDIDNDGIKNPIGIVDDQGRINMSLREKNNDNCLFTVNTNQNDDNKNGMGDACENKSDKLAMYINVYKLGTNAPASIGLDAVTKGSVKTVRWELGDGTIKTGEKINHLYIHPGKYNIKAYANGPNNNATASTTIIVGESIQQKYGIQRQADKLQTNKNSEISFSTIIAGDIDTTERKFSDSNIIKRNPDKTITKVFNKEGTYTVSINAIKEKKIVASTQGTIAVGENKRASVINANKLNPIVGEITSFDTQVAGFTRNDIEAIKRNFGDGTKKINLRLSTTHTYKKPGTKVIIQEIIFKNRGSLVNVITIDVVDKNLSKSFGLGISTPTLHTKINTPTLYTTKNIGASINQNIALIHSAKQGHIDRSMFPFPLPKENTYTYTTEGLVYPQSTLYVNECIALKSQATVAVDGIDFCLQEKIKNNFADLKCDMDQDGIPDICDDDIDGDGVKNLIGIITHENPNCSLSLGLDGDNDLNINTDLLEQHMQGVCSLDNCSFNPNANQSDVNINAIGDACDNENSIENIYQKNKGSLTKNSTSNEIKDTDNDGIYDYEDACPEVAENYNGILDMDGCPEIGQELNCPNYLLFPGQDIPTTRVIPGYCGDGKKAPNENCFNCPEDIGVCDDTCGNNKINFGEQCDDGNKTDGDGCSSTCNLESIESIGDGDILKCPEILNLCSDNTCSFNCDATDEGNAGCNNNGICETSEDCTCPDCENNESSACLEYFTCSNIHQRCCDWVGDGYCNPHCNSVDPDCTQEAICGNGIIESGETCDDGNTFDLDGCDSSCSLESLSGPTCPEGLVLCLDETCSSNCPITDTGPAECNNDNICDDNESCNCPDCDNEEDPCEGGLVCSLIDGNCCDPNPDENCNPNCTSTDPDCDEEGLCGNGSIEPNETCETCPEDIGACDEEDTPECEDPITCITYPPIVTPPCNQCPCPFIDFTSDLSIGDKVKAFLWNTNRSILYDDSRERKIREE